MTIAVPPVTNTQTFGAWLSVTNRLAEIATQNSVTADSTSGGSVTTGNSYVNGHFGAGYLHAETALIGGNLSANSTLSILANVNFTNSVANLTSITANSTSSNLTIRTENTAIVGNTLFVNAAINVTSTAVLGGAVTVANTLSVANVATFNDNINSENIVPQANVTYDLGTPTSLFKNVYTQTVLFATGSANSTQYTGTANNANNLNGQPASFYANATNLTSGTLDAARLSGTYTINVTGTASNATNLNNQPGSFYTNATNITTGTLPWSQAPSGTVNTSGAFTITGIHTHPANVVMGNTTVNTQLSNATILISNSTSTTALGLTDLRIGSTATNVVIANTTSSFGGNVSVTGSLSSANVTAALFTGNVTGTASNATNLNSQPGSFYTNASNLGTGTVNASRLSGTYTIDVTGTASNATNLNNQPASFYTNASNITTGTLATARLPATINTTTINASTVNTVNIVANGSTGTAGQVLSANGTGIYWAPPAATGVTSVASGNGISGGPITSTGTLSVTQGTGTVVNATGVHVNSTYIGTLTANNSTNFNGQPASFYTNASNLGTGTVNAARLPTSSTSQAGIVQLIDSVTNTSVTLAATANSVKTVYDFAATIAATGTPPSGANTNIQFNNSNTFGGSAAFTFNSATNTVTVGSQLNVGANASLSTEFLRIGNSSVNTAISAASITLNGVNVNTAITGNAATAFTNATAFAANATNISSGTLANARLPSAVDVTSVNTAALTVGANFIANATVTRTATSLLVPGASVEGGQIVLGYGNNLANAITGQANNTFNIDVVGGSTTPQLRIFTQNGDGSTTNILNVANTGRVHIGSVVEQTDSTFKVTGTANVTANLTVGGALSGANLTTTTNTATFGTAAYVVANGNVGIGTSTPGARLGVISSANTNDGIFYTNSNTGTGAQAVVGINTQGAFGLQIGQNYTSKNAFIYLADAASLVLSTNAVARMTVDAAGNVVVAGALSSANLTTTTNTATFGTAAYVVANGNFGIGTSSPAYSLDISGTSNTTTGIRISDTNSGQAQLVLTEGANTGQVAESGGVLFITNFAPAGSLALSQANDRPITMTTNNNTRMVISGNGNIGIGNTAPDARLAVTGTANVSGNVVIGGSLNVANVTATVVTGALTGTASNATNLNSQPGSFYTNATNLATGTVPTSRLATGTANTTTFLRGDQTWSTIVGGAVLTANNTDTQTYFFPMANTTSGSWSNGVVANTKLYFVPSTGTLNATIFNSLSDASKKTDVVTIDTGLATVLNMRGVEFNWIDNGERSAGVIAQELEKIAPHLVRADRDGNKSVHYDGIIPYLIQAIHELNDKVRKLENG